MNNFLKKIIEKGWICILILIIASHVVSSLSIVNGQQTGLTVLSKAEMKIESAFQAVALAEEKNADIQDFVKKLNDACSLLVEARNMYNNGEIQGAISKAIECVALSGRIEVQAQFLVTSAAEEAKREKLITFANSLTAVVVIILTSFIAWKIFKKRYHQRVLQMRPEVSNIEP